jgi:predicted protein tyrosine phosphatase
LETKVKVDVFSRNNACVREPTPNTAVISIATPGYPALLKEGWDDVLRLEFHDVVNIPKGMPEAVPFSDTHAEDIHAFIAKHEGKDFMVHCDAGMSRSVAVGAFLKEAHDYELVLHEVETDDGANSRIKRGLMRKHWRETFKDANLEEVPVICTPKD